ncbi:MAG: 30S ribosomal protein S5 [Nanoarchaeota archaeon]|nr:30S ribosomal protein S5 [Nanoarchaeota archaeon]
MAEKETKNEPKDLIEPVPEELDKVEVGLIAEEKEQKSFEEERREREEAKMQSDLDKWAPKTQLGKLVKVGKEKDFDNILTTGKKILEHQIADSLLKLENDLLLIGQAKGKFGGGKRRAWRQTQKKTMEGNIVTFSCMAVVGDRKGHVGIGLGKAKETLPSRQKALRNAKLNIIRVELGYESPEEEKTSPHTVPFIVEGKCGSIRIKLLPAPRGTGLVVGDECKKILKLAGIQDVYGVTKGQTRTTFNLAKACMDALSKTTKMLK